MRFQKAVNHLNIVASGLLLTLVILNHYNPIMGYLTSTASIVFLVMFLLLSAAQAILSLRRIRRSERRRAAKSTEQKE